jgi:hypothetical protein
MGPVQIPSRLRIPPTLHGRSRQLSHQRSARGEIPRAGNPRPHQQITYISHGSTSTASYGGHSDTLAIYSGSTPRLKDAAGFSVDLGEERAGEDLRIPIGKLHTIRGNIVSAHDGHVINAGRGRLSYTDDQSPVLPRRKSSEEDPGFTLNFVYEGDYILTSPISFDVDYELLPGPAFISPRNTPATSGTSTARPPCPCTLTATWMGSLLPFPNPAAKEAQSYKNALQQQEQRN